MDKKFFQELERHSRTVLDTMANRHEADSSRAHALRWAISHSARLYALFDMTYGRPEKEFQELRFNVLARHMLGLGHAEEQ